MSGLGVTVMPEWIQAEGIEQVLDNLERAGATAVATSPYVMTESDADDAGREPPIDAGAGKVRLLDRLLWGKTRTPLHHLARLRGRIFRTIGAWPTSRPRSRS